MSKNNHVVQLSFPKNIGAIHVSNDLTLVERKIMNIILWNACEIEKSTLLQHKTFNRDNKKFYTIDISEIEYILGWESNNRVELKARFLKLVETSLRYNILKKQNTDGGKWNTATSLLSQVTFDESGNTMYYAFSEAIKDIIVKPTLYGWIHLERQKHIESKYSLALFEYLQGSIAISGKRQTKTEYMAIDDYKLLVGGSNSKYNTFKYINQELVKTPIKEINTKTDLSVKPLFQKSGRKVTSIAFDVKDDGEIEVRTQTTNLELDFHKKTKEELEEIDRYVEDSLSKNKDAKKIHDLLISYSISPKKRKEFMENYTLEHIEQNIEYLKSQKTYKNKNDIPTGLVIRAIQDNYANTGEQKKREIEEVKYALLELRTILNNVDRNDERFLRNIIQDYRIYKSRKDIENTKKHKEYVKEALKTLDKLMARLIKIGYKSAEEIYKAADLPTDEIFRSILFFSKEELEEIREEVREKKIDEAKSVLPKFEEHIKPILKNYFSPFHHEWIDNLTIHKQTKATVYIYTETPQTKQIIQTNKEKFNQIFNREFFQFYKKTTKTVIDVWEG